MTFPMHTPETAPADSRRAMEATRAKFGAVPRPVAKMATSPTLLNGFLGASAAFESTSLPPLAREVMVMTVAVRNGCHVCVALHSTVLERLDSPAQDAPAEEEDDDEAVAGPIAIAVDVNEAPDNPTP